jgi:hypothetical protein
VVPKLFAGVHIGDVHLDQRRAQLGARVAQRHRRMSERSGVQHHGVARVGSGMDPIEQIGFAIALSHHGFQTEPLGLVFDQRHQLVVGGAAVDLRLAATESAQVGAVEHQHGLETHCPTAPISE